MWNVWSILWLAAATNAVTVEVAATMLDAALLQETVWCDGQIRMRVWGYAIAAASTTPAPAAATAAAATAFTATAGN